MEKICVIGLGYVGLPLACALAEHFEVVGYDKDKWRVDELKKGRDKTGEVTEKDKILRISATDSVTDITRCNVFIICVPTPIDKYNNPDLTPLDSASRTVGLFLKPGDLVIYESTTYPGCTDEFCYPILKELSRLNDIQYGYSPERMNPGDKEHTVDKITKVVAGCNEEVTDRIAAIYGKITNIYKAPSIRVAEAAKVIENTQRDINIAFMNEIAMLFNEMDINTSEVLEAARTKWNFLDFKPGLVGGHCIGVDPYYLAHAASGHGFHTEMILSGRRTNNKMAAYIANVVAQHQAEYVLILGCTFKKDVPDRRNSLVDKLVKELDRYGMMVFVHDPYYPYPGIPFKVNTVIDTIVYAVDHKDFRDPNFWEQLDSDATIIDLTGTLENADWSL